MMWVMFGEIIDQISCSRFTKDVIMALDNSILYPIKSHINVFCAFLCHPIVDDSIHGGVVHLHGRGRL